MPHPAIAAACYTTVVVQHALTCKENVEHLPRLVHVQPVGVFAASRIANAKPSPAFIRTFWSRSKVSVLMSGRLVKALSSSEGMARTASSCSVPTCSSHTKIPMADCASLEVACRTNACQSVSFLSTLVSNRLSANLPSAGRSSISTSLATAALSVLSQT